jgi:transglutaminase-like putative cysteine protease
MLALLLAFKLLEMHAKRDLYVVLFLGFFLMLTNFFYSQSILTGLAMAATLVVLLTVQLTFQYTGSVPSLGRRLRLAAKMFALATPLAAALFVLFPRVEGPLWGTPGEAQGSRSGLSDTMAPGTMTNLALSEEVAFRVRFDGAPPAPDRLYWRGVVLSQYDGRTWTRIGGRLYRRDGDAMTLRLGGKPAPYEVTLEPSKQRWLFTLELTPPALDVPGEQVDVSDELESFTVRPMHRRVRYRASAFAEYAVQPALDPALTGKWLQLPAGFNPRTRELGRLLRAEPGATDTRIAVRVLDLFRTQRFSYTLQPPLLGRDAIDEFLWVTRQGFCEHYAGAFVFLMRAAGIPARVVTGYQGGELNPVDGYMTVRQSDAHAWAEVWLAGRGWIRVDPTAAVAPDRVRLGLGGALPRDTPFGLSAFRNDKDSWLARIRFHANAANNAWNQWVLDYNPERQRNFLAELFDWRADWRALAALPAALAAGWLWRLLRARRRADPVQTAWDRFGVLLARHGIARTPDEGPHSLAHRVAALALPDEKKAAMAEFLQLYAALRYRALDDDERHRSARRLAKLLSLSR